MARPGDGPMTIVVVALGTDSGDGPSDRVGSPDGAVADLDSAAALLEESRAEIDASTELVAADVELDPAGTAAFDGIEFDLAAVSAFVALGEPALLALMRTGVDAPILPVGSGNGIPSVRPDDLPAALAALEAGSTDILTVPTIDVTADSSAYRAMMDVMAVTAEPARISEYRLTDHKDGQEFVVDTVRADGIVAAAPAGTPGYGTAAGGPIMDPDLEAVTVIPVGPFRVEQPHWVLELPISIQVAREEVAVTLLVDDREVGEIEAGTRVNLDWGDPVEILETPVSSAALGRDRQEEPGR